MTASDLHPALIRLAESAINATTLAAGPLPERIEDFPGFMKEWCRLIRRHDPRLMTLCDHEIEALIRNFGELATYEDNGSVA